MLPAASPYTVVLEFSRAEQAGDPTGFHFAPQEYLLRGPGGSFDEARFPWSDELLADLAALRSARRDPVVVQRLGETLRRFLYAAGWAEQEARLREARAQGQRVLLSIRSAAAELYAIPWELLTLQATGQHLGELPDVLFRYEWPDTQTAPEVPAPRSERGRILLAWSAAGGAVPAAEHQSAIVGASQRGHLPFDPDRDVLAHVSAERLSERLTQAAAAQAPISVLHILCHGAAHGSTFGLAWDGASGSELIDGDLLRRLLDPHKGQLRLVVLCACDSGNSGQLGNQLGSLSQLLHRIGIQAVVASRFPLSVAGSVSLTAALYDTLLGGPASLESALLAARRALAERPGLDWASLQLYSRAADGEDTRPLVFRPYRGLLTYQPEHQRFLYGREAEIAEVLGDLAALRKQGRPLFLFVAGASGTGKSSLVLAGVAPRLLAEPGWRLARLRVGGDPVAALESALAEHQGPAQQLLLVVDQFEELFTQVESAAQRQRFIDRLWALASAPRSGVTIVATLRVDYIGQCGELVLDGGRLRLDQLAYDEAHRVFIAQLGREQLRSTILGPAQRVGLLLESGLAERIIEDVAGEPGSLPLIADTLDLLWQQRARRCLTQAAYDALGGVTGALRQRADALIDGLGAGSQRAARRLLVRLVSNVEDTARGTRRRLPLAAVRPADRDEAASFDRLVQQLVEARLLVQDGEGSAQMIEVAHEALIRKWERLASWVLADRKMLAELEKLAGWVAQRAEHQTLLDDNQLGYATLVKSRYPDDLPPGASELIAASRDASNGRRRTRQRTILALIVLSLTSLAFGGYGLDRSLRAERASEKERLARQDEQAANRDVLEKRESLRQKLIDTYIEQGRQYLVEQRDAVRALLWFNRAYQQGSTSKALPFLLAQSHYELDSLLLTIPGGIRITNTEPRRLEVGAAPIFSPDGNRLLTADGQSGSARLFDAQASKPLQSLGGHRGPVTALAFSPDGQRIATASTDGAVKLWDAASTSELASFAASAAVTALSFNKDGSLLAVASARDLELWDVAKQQRRWQKRAERATEQPPFGEGYSAVAFSADEERVVGTGHYAASAWTVAQGKACWSFPMIGDEPQPFRSFYGSRADRLLMVLGRDEDRQDSVLHSGVTGKPEGSVPHSTAAFAAAFNAPGTRLLIGDWIDGVRLWNPQTREQVLALPPDNVLYAATFSATGAYFAGVSPTGGRLWSSESGRLVQSLVANSQQLMGVAISSTGNRLATAAEDGTVMLWDITRNALGVGAIRSPGVNKLLLDAVKYPDSPSDAEPPKGQVYLRSPGGRIVEVYAPGDQLLWRLSSGGNTTRSLISPDGSLIVTWSAASDGEMGEPAEGVSSVRIWAVESGKLLYELTQDAALLFAAAMDGVGPDGKPKSALPAELLRRPPGREQLNAFVSARLPLHFEGESLVENQR